MFNIFLHEDKSSNSKNGKNNEELLKQQISTNITKMTFGNKI